MGCGRSSLRVGNQAISKRLSPYPGNEGNPQIPPCQTKDSQQQNVKISKSTQVDFLQEQVSLINQQDHDFEEGSSSSSIKGENSLTPQLESKRALRNLNSTLPPILDRRIYRETSRFLTKMNSGDISYRGRTAKRRMGPKKEDYDSELGDSSSEDSKTVLKNLFNEDLYNSTMHFKFSLKEGEISDQTSTLNTAKVLNQKNRPKLFSRSFSQERIFQLRPRNFSVMANKNMRNFSNPKKNIHEDKKKESSTGCSLRNWNLGSKEDNKKGQKDGRKLGIGFNSIILRNPRTLKRSATEANIGNVKNLSGFCEVRR